MNIYVDLDNTLCLTSGSDYENSRPIESRIVKVNNLKEQGNQIIIWTARGSNSGIDWSELTKNQLQKWNIKYDKLLLQKPPYDLYIDDKSINVDQYWKIPNNGPTRKIDSKIVKKGWCEEVLFVNNYEYCGKILRFNSGKKFSMHFHIEKKETWYIAKGSFLFSWIDTINGITYTEILNRGDVITNERGSPHQMEALEDSEIFEVSTFHKDADSYRVYKGD